jgi:hypothetical protein
MTPGGAIFYRLEVPWKIDIRQGVAVIGNTRRQGYTLMRDPEKRIFAFHAVEDDAYDPAAVEAHRPNDQFVIQEEAFEPT